MIWKCVCKVTFLGVLVFGVGVLFAQKSLTTQDQQKIIEGQIKILTSPSASLDTRKIAAGLLIDINVPQARQKLLEILKSSDEEQVKLAIVEVLAERDEIPKEFITPLFNILLSKDAKLRESSSIALARLRDKSVIEKCYKISVDVNQPLDIRILAVRTLGRIRTKESVSELIRLLKQYSRGGGRFPPELIEACTKALTDLTAQDYAQDVDGWINWWGKYEGKSPTRWLQDQLDFLITQNRKLERRLDTTEKAFVDTVLKLYRLIPNSEDQKKKILAELLSGKLPVQRLGGLYILERSRLSQADLSKETLDKICELISDSDPSVRRKAIQVAGVMGIKPSLSVLLSQLKTERNADIRAAILDVIGQFGGPKEVLRIIGDMNSPIEQVAISAIRAVGSIAEEHKLTGKVRSAVIGALLERYKKLDKSQTRVKQELIHVMAIIADKAFLPIFKESLNSTESAIRLDSVRGLIALEDKSLVEFLIAHLNDPDPGVRAKIISGIADLTYDPKIVEILLARLNPKVEQDKPVRQITWNTILLMIKRWRLEDQIVWAEKLVNSEYVSREQMIELVDILNSQFIANSSNISADEKCSILISLGNLLLSVGISEEAIKYYKQAIQTTHQLLPGKSHNVATSIILSLIRNRTTPRVVGEFISGLPRIIGKEQFCKVMEVIVKSEDKEYVKLVLKEMNPAVFEMLSEELKKIISSMISPVSTQPTTTKSSTH